MLFGEHTNEIYTRNALAISHQYLQDMANENQVQSSVLTHSPDDYRYPYLCSMVEFTNSQEKFDDIKLPVNLAGVKQPVYEYTDNGLEYESSGGAQIHEF